MPAWLFSAILVVAGALIGLVCGYFTARAEFKKIVNSKFDELTEYVNGFIKEDDLK